MENVNQNGEFNHWLMAECVAWCNDLIKKVPEIEEFNHKNEILVNEWKEKFSAFNSGSWYCKVSSGYELGVLRVHLYLSDFWGNDHSILTFVLLPNWKFKIIRPYLVKLLKGDTTYTIVEDHLRKIVGGTNKTWKDLYNWIENEADKLSSDWQLRETIKPKKREFYSTILPEILSCIQKGN